jgi:arsenite methyltransferase
MGENPHIKNRMPTTATKINYGIDAPGVIRNLIGAGLLLIILVLIFPVIKLGPVIIETRGLVWSGSFIILGGLMMLFYSLKGKQMHRDRMLNVVAWRGDEQVLDVGTGKGLLMVGAAKRLNTGKSTGIDIWNAEDLTGNNYDNALNNAALEGVGDKVAVLNENAMAMSFADETFDVIVTNQVIHNIYNQPGRFTACQEIARVLKKGGTAVISDWKHMGEYQKNFNQIGLQTEMLGANYLTTYPPLRILVVRK